jgi:hypothetical protein
MADESKPAAKKTRMPKTHNRPSNRAAKLSPKIAGRLTDAEAKYMTARLNGATMQEATAAAGLAPFPQTGYKIEKRIAEKCPAVFERVGVTIELIAKKVLDKLEAKTTKFFANKGIVLDQRDVEDNTTQLNAAELGLKALGALKHDDDANSNGHQSHGHSIRVVVSDVTAAKALSQLFAPRGTTGIVLDVGEEVDENVGRT